MTFYYKLEESYKAREDSEKLLKTKCKEIETLKKQMKEVRRNVFNDR